MHITAPMCFNPRSSLGSLVDIQLVGASSRRFITDNNIRRFVLFILLWGWVHSMWSGVSLYTKSGWNFFLNLHLNQRRMVLFFYLFFMRTAAAPDPCESTPLWVSHPLLSWIKKQKKARGRGEHSHLPYL